MIVVAVVAIIAAIAYPSYIEHVRRARLTDAQMVLMEAAQWMEREYTRNNHYPAASDFSEAFSKSPKDGTDTFYRITKSPEDAGQGYTLQATPQDDQTKYKRCDQALTLSNLGVRGPSEYPDCWK